jgi:hypothetical protein
MESRLFLYFRVTNDLPHLAEDMEGRTEVDDALGDHRNDDWLRRSRSIACTGSAPFSIHHGELLGEAAGGHRRLARLGSLSRDSGGYFGNVSPGLTTRIWWSVNLKCDPGSSSFGMWQPVQLCRAFGQVWPEPGP